MECGGTGYKGRTAICELLDVTDSIRELILAREEQRRHQAGGARGGDDLPARVGGRPRPWAGKTTLHGDQQGHVRGGGVKPRRRVAAWPRRCIAARAGCAGSSSSPSWPHVAVEVRPARGLRGAPRARRGRPQPGRRPPPSTCPRGCSSVSLTKPNVVDGAGLSAARSRTPARAGGRPAGAAAMALVLPDPAVRVALLPAAEVKGRPGRDGGAGPLPAAQGHALRRAGSAAGAGPVRGPARSWWRRSSGPCSRATRGACRDARPASPASWSRSSLALLAVARRPGRAIGCS